MNKINIVLNKEKYTPTAGVHSHVNWKRLLPYLKKETVCGKDETIVGLQVDENGVTVQIDNI